MAKNTAVEKKRSTQVSTQIELDFAADAGLGMEGADKASFAIPFLVLLQSNSPQLETVDKAKAGLFINSVTNDLFASVKVVPVAFQRRYLAWAPRSAGGGFKGEYSVAQVEAPANELKWKRDAEGHMVMPDGSILKDTRNHFVLLTNGDHVQQALISLSSTQIKKSKKWMSRIQSVQMKDTSGKSFNPPSFSHVYECTSVNEENDKGKWKGMEINLVGPVTDKSVYDAAKAFHTLIVAGKVEVAPPPAGSEGGTEEF